jgi:hypothetical protein
MLNNAAETRFFDRRCAQEAFGVTIGPRSETMRNLFAAATLFAGLYLLVPGQAMAAPPPLADHAVSSRAHAVSLTEQVRAKAGKQTYVRRKSLNKTVKLRRRDDWTYYPYWRPYQYYNWQYIYPYGGPLF